MAWFDIKGEKTDQAGTLVGPQISSDHGNWTVSTGGSKAYAANRAADPVAATYGAAADVLGLSDASGGGGIDPAILLIGGVFVLVLLKRKGA